MPFPGIPDLTANRIEPIIMNCECIHYDVCQRRRLKGRDSCILHAEGEKDLDAFHRALGEHQSSNFDHIVFPPNSVPFYNPVSCGSSISFSRAVFNTVVHFQNTDFQREVDFAGVLFEEQVFFRGAHFLGDCDFSGAKFMKGADFRECCFGSSCSFEQSSFHTGFEIEGADFAGANFRSEANFSDATFHGSALFGGASFEGSTSFQGAQFLNYACLSSQFTGPTIFEKVRFEDSLDLRGAKVNHIPDPDGFLLQRNRH